MSQFEDRKEPAVDMNRFRRDLRRMWKEMVRMYKEEGFIYRSGDGRLAFRKVQFPEVELIQRKRTEEDA